MLDSKLQEVLRSRNGNPAAQSSYQDALRAESEEIFPKNNLFSTNQVDKKSVPDGRNHKWNTNQHGNSCCAQHGRKKPPAKSQHAQMHIRHHHPSIRNDPIIWPPRRQPRRRRIRRPSQPTPAPERRSRRTSTAWSWTQGTRTPAWPLPRPARSSGHRRPSCSR